MFGWLGPFGVALFFALSGRLMSGLLFVKRVNLTDFFVRRATRVLPTFWLFVMTMAVATLAEPVWQAEELSTLAFLRTYYPSESSIFTSSLAIGHLWSRNVEEHTYVWLAGCAVLVRVFRIPAYWVLFGTVMLLPAFMAIT